MTLAQLSYLAMVSAAIVYLLAMMAHAAEWGFSRGAEAGHVSRRVDASGRVGVTLSGLALGAHVVGVVTRGLAAHRAPWGNMYEFVTSSLAFVMIAYLVLATRYRMRWLGLAMTLLATARTRPPPGRAGPPAPPPHPRVHPAWSHIPLDPAAVSAAAFKVGGGATVLYLLKQRAERRGATTG